MKPDSGSKPENLIVQVGCGAAVIFIAPILLELAASDERCPSVTLLRQPLEELIEDWLRRGEEIRALRDLLRLA